MKMPLTTFVLVDFGTDFHPDLTFLETDLGMTSERLMQKICDGDFVAPVRGVFYASNGSFIDATQEWAQQLSEMPADMISEVGREFVRHCGYDIQQAAE